jgi:hypothetical protein
MVDIVCFPMSATRIRSYEENGNLGDSGGTIRHALLVLCERSDGEERMLVGWAAGA